jgi:hypothetical protein
MGTLFPAPLHLRLDRHRLERLDTGDAFYQKRLVFGAAPKFFIQPGSKQWRRRGGYADVERERTYDDERQKREIQKHHSQKHETEEQIDHKRKRRTG